jgi:histidinol dehydrogenase
MRLIRTTGRGAKDAEKAIAALERRGSALDRRTVSAVGKIIGDVRKGGDAALRRYARKLDGLSDQAPLQIPREEMEQAWRDTPAALQDALKAAAANIRAFAERQLPKDWDANSGSGLRVGQRIRPLDAVGCYVPSGRYPLPSTLLMTVIPAQVAGVPRIVVVSPRPARETLAAAFLLGVENLYRIGGAQAIAALAYGTESLPRVNKIVGPGNSWVTTAKRLVAFDCAIDMLAGPTEIVVTSDVGDSEAIASDLVAQAEHDPEALAVFITTRMELARAVMAAVKRRVKQNSIAKQSIARNGIVIVTNSADEARALTNRLAPEHLTVDSEADLAWVASAGSVFIGGHSPQPMGDYISGPNHTLPTGGLAAARGGLSVLDYVKIITVQQYTPEGLARLGPQAICLAEAEGLKGHAEAIRARGVDA